MSVETTGDFEVVVSSETTTEVVRRVRALNLGVQVVHRTGRIPLLTGTSTLSTPPPPTNLVVMPPAYVSDDYARSERAYKAKKKQKADRARDPTQRWRC